jgi:hypothetical protein
MLSDVDVIRSSDRYDNFDWWRTWRSWSRLQTKSNSDPTTITPLLCWLLTTHNAIDLAEKAFLQANREHKQERDECNLKLQVNMKLMDLIEGSRLVSKGLVATSGQD